jgi:hypothetical protein
MEPNQHGSNIRNGEIQMQAQDVPVLWHFVSKALIGLALTGLGGLILWPFKIAKKEWASLKEAIASTHAELVTQRTDSLGVLKEQGEKQVELLGKVANTLEAMHLDQRTLLGRLDK